MKRFVDTERWMDPWFRRLTSTQKLLWQYLWDTCDGAGIFRFDPELAGIFIGVAIPEDSLVAFQNRVESLGNDKWIFKDFIKFQCGKLSRQCKAHSRVFSILEEHGIDPDEIAQAETFSNVVSSNIRQRVIARDGEVCVYSGRPLMPWEIEIDHIIPRSKGGTNNLSNLVVCDKELNRLKRDMSLEEFCTKAGLSFEGVCERVRKALRKGSNPLGTLQEEEKDKYKEKDRERVVRGNQTQDDDKATRVYEAYPVHVGKPAALKAIQKALRTEPFESLLDKTLRYKAARENNIAFTPHPATWFNQERYNDPPETWVRNGEQKPQSELTLEEKEVQALSRETMRKFGQPGTG